jgi:flavin-dependent dehydrogenase
VVDTGRTASSVTHADVIVVGAGPSGCSTAWHLARAGVDVVLLDRARFPRDKPCSEYLSPEASRILSAMGALDACERSGAARLAGMIVRAPNGATLRGDFAAAHGFRGFRDHGLALRRRLLDEILLGRAGTAGARVQQGIRVVDLLRAADGAVCGVRALAPDGSAREVRARIVVGADGLRSIVARRLGLAHFARVPRRLALVTHYVGVQGMSEYGEMHVERDGYLGLARVGDDVVNVAVVVPFAQARAASGSAAGFFERWLLARPHVAPRFDRAERISPVRATGPFAQRAHRAWARGAALVGDAADFFDPFTGEGIYAALRGGELLAPALVNALAAPTLKAADAAMAAYDRARRREFGGKWKLERLIGLAVALPGVMNHAAAVLARRKDLADLLVGVTGDFVPPRQVLSPGYVAALLFGGGVRRRGRASSTRQSRPHSDPLTSDRSCPAPGSRC